MFGLSPLEPAEPCLLWNLIRSPVSPSCFHRTTNNSVQMTPARFASDALPLLHLWPHPYPEWEAPWGVWHITITLPCSPVLLSLGFFVPRKIFSPMSEQQHTGNWCHSHSARLRTYCSLDTSCSIARLLIWDWSITTCSILCVAKLVLAAHHPFSLDSNKDLTSRYISLPSEGFKQAVTATFIVRCIWYWDVEKWILATFRDFKLISKSTHSCAPLDIIVFFKYSLTDGLNSSPIQVYILT